MFNGISHRFVAELPLSPCWVPEIEWVSVTVCDRSCNGREYYCNYCAIWEWKRSRLSEDKGSHVEAFVELGPNKLTDRTCTVGVQAVATRTKVKRARAAAQRRQPDSSSGKHSKRSAHLDDFAVTLWPIDRGRGRLSMSPLLGQMNELDGVAHWTQHFISKPSFLAAIIPLNAFPTLGRGRVRRGQASRRTFLGFSNNTWYELDQKQLKHWTKWFVLCKWWFMKVALRRLTTY